MRERILSLSKRLLSAQRLARSQSCSLKKLRVVIEETKISQQPVFWLLH